MGIISLSKKVLGDAIAPSMLLGVMETNDALGVSVSGRMVRQLCFVLASHYAFSLTKCLVNRFNVLGDVLLQG